jgi:hypothetical protein
MVLAWGLGGMALPLVLLNYDKSSLAVEGRSAKSCTSSIARDPEIVNIVIGLGRADKRHCAVH